MLINIEAKVFKNDTISTNSCTLYILEWEILCDFIDLKTCHHRVKSSSDITMHSAHEYLQLKTVEFQKI